MDHTSLTPQPDPETIRTIYERRAIRKYADKPVSRSIIEKILDAGRMAPSAFNEQPWKFYVVTNQQSIAVFSKAIRKTAVKKLLKAGPKKILNGILMLLRFSHGFHFSTTSDHVFYKAPVVIFITSQKNNEWAGLDIGMCVQNMMLAAHALGLGSCPVGFGKYVEQTKAYAMLHIPPAETIHLSLILGYAEETPEAHKRKINNAVFFE